MIPKNHDMRVEVTTKCNYSCVICPRHKLTRKIETMSLGLFKNIFDKVMSETDQYNTLTFPGMGEPLIDPTLNEKIRYAKKRRKGLAVLILTNAYYLTPERFKELEDLGVSSIRVSFYGIDPESYSYSHGVKDKGVFLKVRDNLKKIACIKKDTKLLFTFNIIRDVNEKMVEDWIKLWKDKSDLNEVWYPHNWVDGKNYRKVQRKKLKSCGRPFKGPLQVQADGTVNMCCFDFDGKLTLGDIKTETLSEIFDSHLYRKIKECHSTGRFEGSGLICERCDQRNSDKSDVLLYDSKFDVKERVNMISTNYSRLT